LYKLITVGAYGVGKSAITTRLCHGVFEEYSYDPTIEPSLRKQMTVSDDDVVMIDVADVNGREDTKLMREVMIRCAQGFLLIFDITSYASLKEVYEIHERILQIKDEDHQPIILVGNKSDLESKRQVKKEEAEELAKKWEIPFFETSALNGTNITESFTTLIKEIRKYEKPESDVPLERRLRGKHAGCVLF